MNIFHVKIYLFLFNLRCAALELMQQLKEFFQLLMIFGQERREIDTLAAALAVKFNMKDISCSNISNILLEDDTLTKNIHSMEKYSFK